MEDDLFGFTSPAAAELYNRIWQPRNMSWPEIYASRYRDSWIDYLYQGPPVVKKVKYLNEIKWD